jgi:hypothetical protein
MARRRLLPVSISAARVGSRRGAHFALLLPLVFLEQES